MSASNTLTLDDLNEQELAFLLDIRMLTEKQRDEIENLMKSFNDENSFGRKQEKTE